MRKSGNVEIGICKEYWIVNVINDAAVEINVNLLQSVIGVRWDWNVLGLFVFCIETYI